MVDNIVTDPGTGGALIATKDDGTAHHQKMLTEYLNSVSGDVVSVTEEVGLPVTISDGAMVDAFGRLRSSEVSTIFANKQLHDSAPLFWDDQEISGAGTSSTHSPGLASTVMGTSLNTAGLRCRQTFQRFNYQPGKSQQIFMTGAFGAGVVGITRRIGLFDDDNGLFFEQVDASFGVTVRSDSSGSPVDSPILQAAWNLDKLDGTGLSGETLDLTKSHIMVIDFQWLGSGRVRFGFDLGGRTVYVHEIDHSNNLLGPYMSTPNLPIRYEITSGASSPASTLLHTCVSVMSEGGGGVTGVRRAVSTGAVAITYPDIGTIYSVFNIRLKSTHIDATIIIQHIEILISAGNNTIGEWMLIHEPTLAGDALSWQDVDDSAIQTANGNNTNIVSGGHVIGSGYVLSARVGSFSQEDIPSVLALGAHIDGTRHTVALCVRPITTNLSIHGIIEYSEVQ